MKPVSVYVLGIGNPAREDDGIGPAIIEAVDGKRFEGVTVEANYQLTVEDAAAIAEHDCVVFVDASVDAAEPFSFSPVEPKRSDSFSTHSVLPQDVLGMAHEMFHSEAKGYALAVRGYSYRMFTEEMTDAAIENVEAATEFLSDLLESKEFDGATGGNS